MLVSDETLGREVGRSDALHHQLSFSQSAFCPNFVPVYQAYELNQEMKTLMLDNLVPECRDVRGVKVREPVVGHWASAEKTSKQHQDQ